MGLSEICPWATGNIYLMKRKTVVVLYVTIILHVHGSAGKQTDEWYRMTCDPDIGCSI